MKWIKITDCNKEDIPLYTDLIVYPYPEEYINTASYCRIKGWYYTCYDNYGVNTIPCNPTHYLQLTEPED